MAKKFSLFREELKRVWRELRGPRITPARAAIAVALGLFVGSQPIFGCHTPIILFLCVWFQLDGAIMWVASNISNPFFAPFLLTAEVQVGAYVRTGTMLRLDRAITQSGAFSSFAGYMFLGAPFVGAALATGGGLVTYGAVALKRVFFPNAKAPEPYRLPDNAPPWILAAEHVAQRYAPPEDSTPKERTRFHYVRTKLVSDPIAKLVADSAGEEPGALGALLDIGTGRGQLPLLLLELGRATSAFGLDWDSPKIEDAARAAGDHGPELPKLDARFERADAREAELPPSDTVLLIDLLHYFTVPEQDAILERAARAVRPGGRLFLREADADRGWRSTMTLAEERFFTLFRWNRGERVHFRKAKDITALLESEGMVVEVRPAWGKTPFSNVLFFATKPGATTQQP